VILNRDYTKLLFFSFFITLFFSIILISCKENNTNHITPTLIPSPDSSLPSSEKEYVILYQKIKNSVNDMHVIKGFLLYEFLNGGIVKRDSSDNINLNYKGYLTGPVKSGKYGKYFYISASSSPVKKIYNSYYFDFYIKNQTLWCEDNGKTEKIVSSSSDKFPSSFRVSKDNKYIACVMTEFPENNSSEPILFNSHIRDSELILYNTESKKLKTLLNGNYNKQLFISFFAFSSENDVLYTVKYENDIFNLVSIDLTTGKISEFNKIFPSFDWNKLKLKKFFEKASGMPPVFYFSPDKTRLLICNNYTKNFSSDCNDVECMLTAVKIPENSVETYVCENGYIQDLTWKYDSKEFAFILLTNCGCYPDYIDSTIIKMNRNGKERKTLVFKKKNKMTSIGWSPDGKEIAYSIYGMDFIGRINTVIPETREIKEIINTLVNEKKINKKEPVVLDFTDWISGKNQRL